MATCQVCATRAHEQAKQKRMILQASARDPDVELRAARRAEIEAEEKMRRAMRDR